MAVAKQNLPKKRGRPPIKDTKTKTTNVNSSVEKAVCYCCGGKNQSDFYKSHNRFNKHFQVIPYCKKCMRTNMWEYFIQKYNGNEQLALHGLLRSLNLPYIHNLYLASLKNLSNPNAKINNVDNSEEDNNNVLISAYMKNYNSLYSRNGYGDTYLDSEDLGQVSGLSEYEEIIKVKYNKENKNKASPDYEIIEYDVDYLIAKYGNHPPEDLAFLEEQFLQWKDKLGKFIYEKSTEMNVIMLCIEYLKKRKKDELGEKTKEEVDTIQKIMTMSGLLEKQNQNAKLETVIGMEIDNIEKSRPIKPVSTDLDDVDGYKKQIECFVGALSRALGKENKFVKVFEEHMGEYSLDIFKEPEVKEEEKDKLDE